MHLLIILSSEVPHASLDPQAAAGPLIFEIGNQHFRQVVRVRNGLLIAEVVEKEALAIKYLMYSPV